MKNMKKFMSLALTASLVAAGFAGCGSKDDTSSSAGNESSSAAGENVFKIGGIGPVTGPAGAYGDAVDKGARLAVKEINAAGGIGGSQIEFKFEDDEHDAEKSVNAYNTLKDWGMQMLVGTVTSTPCIAVAAESEADNMFLLTPSATAVESIAPSNAFRLCFSDPAQGTKSAEYIGENKLASKVAVVYDSSDTYSSGVYENFVKEAKNQGLEIVASEAFTSDSKSDFNVQLQKAKDGGAELIFLPIYYQEASLILKQAHDIGFDTQFFGCDGLDGILGVENFDTSLAEGTMLLTPFVPDAQDEATQKFVKAYAEEYKDEVPIQFAADAYDCIYAIKEAAEKAGIPPDMSVSDICDALKTSMTEITVDGVTGHITWTEDGEPSKEPKAVKIENGAYTAM